MLGQKCTATNQPLLSLVGAARSVPETEGFVEVFSPSTLRSCMRLSNSWCAPVNGFAIPAWHPAPPALLAGAPQPVQGCCAGGCTATCSFQPHRRGGEPPPMADVRADVCLISTGCAL